MSVELIIASIALVLAGFCLLAPVALSAWLGYLDTQVDILGEALAVHGSGLAEADASGARAEWVAVQNDLLTRLDRVVRLRNLLVGFSEPNERYRIYIHGPEEELPF